MNKKVLVIGDLNVDLIINGLDLLPQLGHELVTDRMHTVLGGSSAIFAAGLARLGIAVELMAQVGADYHGDFLLRELESRGVGTQYVTMDSTLPTGMTLSLSYPTDRALITNIGGNAAFAAADLDYELLTAYDHLHVGALFLQPQLRSDICTLFQCARDHDLTISLDPGYDPQEQWVDEKFMALLPAVDVLLLNDLEARAMAETQDLDAALHRLGRSGPLIVSKCGAEGARALKNDGIIHVPGFTVDVTDTTGAGDSFDAGFIFAHLLQEMPLQDALRFANVCGALSATGIGGTATQPTLEQAQRFLKHAEWAPASQNS